VSFTILVGSLALSAPALYQPAPGGAGTIALDSGHEEEQLGATGLSADPREYQRRLDEQPAEQIDAWCAELMRDISIRRGVREVLHGYMAATRLDERQLERVYASGGGPPAAIGQTAEGEMMIPAIPRSLRRS
jgi:hypothetical protein